MEVEQGIHRIGSKILNFYAIEDGERLTFIDTGVPGYWDKIPRFLASIGRSVKDVSAIVTTHYHSDHVGCTERLRAESGATVFVHGLEAAGLRGDQKPVATRGLGKTLLNPRAVLSVGHMMKNGFSKMPPVAEVETFEDGHVLDVPGKLKAISTPGHSPGHSVFLSEEKGVLFTGDALVTLNFKGQTGPRLMDINTDEKEARRSLARLNEVDAELLLPGHGEPWRGKPSEAAAEAARA